MLNNTRRGLHCASGHMMAPGENLLYKGVIIPISSTKNPIVPVDILSNRYLKNTLSIDYKQRLPCFCRYYGANLEYFSEFS